MISVVILSWERVDGVKKICGQLSRDPLVDEIIVWNNNPVVHLSPPAEKVRVINCTDDFGLYTRFAAASLARNACVLFHDDDLMAEDGVLEKLYEHWRGDPQVCHTLFGRWPGPGGEYTTGQVVGRVEIVLTRFTLAPRAACVHAMAKTPLFADLPGKPIGNGEDIILSHAAMDLSGRVNRGYNYPTTELGQDDDVSIHLRWSGHDAHRGAIIRRCREVFSVSGLLKSERSRRGLRRSYFRLRERAGAIRQRLFGVRNKTESAR